MTKQETKEMNYYHHTLFPACSHGGFFPTEDEMDVIDDGFEAYRETTGEWVDPLPRYKWLCDHLGERLETEPLTSDLVAEELAAYEKSLSAE